MKKFFTLCLLFTVLLSASADEIVKRYTVGKPQVKQNGLQQTVNFDQAMLSGKPGEPVLPYFAVNLLLPPGHEAVSIRFEGSGETLIPGNFNLVSGQYSRPLSEPGVPLNLRNEEVYRSMSAYPEISTGALSTQYMNGYAFAQTVFTPVIYIPGKGELKYFEQVTIRIQTRETEKGREALKNLSASPSVKENCLRNAQNTETAGLYAAPTRSVSDYEILIITPEAFVDQFDALTQLYLPRGMKTQITTTAYIQANSTGVDMPEKIRNYIIQEYQQHGIEHVVLGGDVEHVAYRGFYCHVQSSSAYEDYNIPSDLYYSALDGNWNTNGNNVWGEIGEDDLLPEVSVGRLSFSNTAELAAMLNKTIKYQNEPVLGELRNPLLAGEHLYDTPETWGSDYLELLIGTHSDNGYTTTGIPEDHNILKMYDEESNWSSSQLISAINSGRNFIHHVGHANETYVMKLSNWDITNSNFSGVNGITHNFPVISTHGCICGAFDYNDCIAEKMVSIDNFAAVFIGNSRYGWFNEGQTEGPSAHLHREYVDAMFNDKLNRAGRAQVESKAATSPWVNAPGQWEEGALRWCFYDCNVLGDPALAIWTDEPIPVATAYPATLTTGTPQFEVTVTSMGAPVEGLTAALLKDGLLAGKGITAGNGTATVVIDPLIVEPGEAQLVISGYNCLPVYYTINFVAGQTAYVVYQAYTLDDATGNSNGLPDFGEQISLSITLQNLGLAEAQNVDATISTNDPYVTILDGTESYGDIPAGGEVTISNGFTIQLASDIPDNHIVAFTMEANGDDTWLSEFQLSANAPVIVAGAAEVDDNEGNGVPDPGETFNLNIELINSGHAASLPLNATLSCNSQFISGTQWTAPEVVIDEQSQASVIFSNIEADDQTPLGTSVTFVLTITQGDPATTILEHAYVFVIGQVSEDFETGDFTHHAWAHSGNANWTISPESPFEGAYSARSGDISDNQKSDLSVTYEVLTDDSIHFCYRVSSEESYDFLRFYIDNIKVAEWSGDIVWNRASFAVSTGLHTFKWSYEKDITVSNGEDAAWIDDILFPPVDISTGYSGPEKLSANLLVYPNPTSGKIFINLNGAALKFTQLTITDLAGKQVFNATLTNTDARPLDLSGLEPGLYFLSISGNGVRETQKLIIE
jgi:hypothetical protein